MAISPTAGRRAGLAEVLPNLPGEGLAEKPRPSKSFPHSLAKARPSSQRTQQMEKDLQVTLLKRYEEAKALEKKRKKEKEIKKSNHEGSSPDWCPYPFFLYSLLVFMFAFPCANTPCRL
jgi:hypothetical protein